MTCLKPIGELLGGRGDDESWKLKWKDWNVFIRD
jgi:hypothetical protein